MNNSQSLELFFIFFPKYGGVILSFFPKNRIIEEFSAFNSFVMSALITLDMVFFITSERDL
jgi:hypothetical protein